MIRPAKQAPDAIVGVIRFDKTVGPVLLWTTLADQLSSPSNSDNLKDTQNIELDIALYEVLPMYALPEGASSKRNNKTNNQGSQKKKNKSFQLEITNESRFLLPVGSNNEVLFGCSVYVVVAESFSNGGRGASQFSVTLLTKAPAMELLIDRLRSVASVTIYIFFISLSLLSFLSLIFVYCPSINSIIYLHLTNYTPVFILFQ